MLFIFFCLVGPKVISRVLTVESVEEITDVLRRPPVIWDNLHANDYDQKRVFLGPYSGRSPDLIPKLRGVLTNPNCEYGANFVAIHTLAQWSRCNVDGKRDPSISKYLTCVSDRLVIFFPYLVGKGSYVINSRVSVLPENF
jgi:protein O-GlcNAcase/histone acetyltransferase